MNKGAQAVIEEEIRNLLTEEGLCEIKRSIILVKSGHLIQKCAVYERMSKLVGQPLFGQLFTVLKEDIFQLDDDSLLVLCRQFAIASSKLSPTEQYSLLQICASFLRSNKSHIGWVELFGTLFKSDLMLSQNLIFELCSGDIDYKIKAAKLMAFLPILEKLAQLALDASSLVRIEVCKAIRNSIEQLDAESLTSYFLLKIFSLIYDKDSDTRSAAVHMLFVIQHKLLGREQFMVRYFMEFMLTNSLEITMSKIAGQALQNLLDLKPDIAKFVKLFTNFGESNNEQVRKNWAYNFAGVVYLLKAEHFSFQRHQYLDSMEHDNSVDVRSILQASCAEVIQIVTINDKQAIIQAIKRQLDQQIIQQRFGAIVKALGHEDVQCRALIGELLVALSKKLNSVILESMLECHPEMQRSGEYESLEVLTKFLNTDMRFLAAKNLAYVIHQDDILLEKVTAMTLQAKNYQLRQAYVSIITQLVQLCSAKYFQQNRLARVLQLAYDPVKAVKIALSRILIFIYAFLPDNDEALLQNYNNARSHLLKYYITAEIIRANEKNESAIDLNQRELNELKQAPTRNGSVIEVRDKQKKQEGIRQAQKALTGSKVANRQISPPQRKSSMPPIKNSRKQKEALIRGKK